MKVLLHHEHPGAKRLHGSRGHKLLRKMAKLEKRLGRYHLEESGEESCSSAASGVRSRSRRRHRGDRHQRRRHGRRCASLGRGRSSSSSSSGCSDSDASSDSGTSASSGSDASSRSPSPGPGHHRHRHHRRHHGPPRHPSRSKSFAGRGCGSPPPCHHRHHHRPHSPAHHRDHHHHGHWRRNAMHKHRDGICGLLFRSLCQSEPNLPEAEAPNAGESRRKEVVREPEVVGTNDVQEDSRQEAGSEEASLELGPEVSEELSEKLTETLKKGLLADAKKSLLQKYPTSKNFPQLRGPKLNQEFLPVASETAVKRDAVLLYEQNQIGTGLTALSQAINELNAKGEAEHNLELIPILDAMDDAAAIIADAHHNITQMRQAFLAGELNKRVRPVVDACEADELLFGKGFGDKVKDVRAFGKGRKGCEKKDKRKHMDQGGEKRKSKRLHHHGIMH